MLILIYVCFSPQCAQEKLLAAWVSAKGQANMKNNQIILISTNTECFYSTEKLEINFWKPSESQNHSVACRSCFFWMRPGIQLVFRVATVHCHLTLIFSQHSQVLLRAVLNPSPTLPILVVGISLTQVQDSVLGLLELYEVGRDLPLKPVLTPQQSLVSSSERLKGRCL